MARMSFDEKLSHLKKLGEGPRSDEAVREICRVLSGTNGVLAAEAVRVAVKLDLRDLADDLASAYYRFLENPLKKDPGCHAKLAAVEALSALEYGKADVFLHGIRYVQMEPAFGPPVDTADRLRAACAFALCRLDHPDLPYETVGLLADREPAARQAAVRILAESGRQWGELLLRMKALQGDEKPEIMGDCFSGLMAIDSRHSLPFVERFLSANVPGVVEEAALSIGNSRMEEAFDLLCDYRSSSADSDFKRMLLLPIGLTRSQEAFEYLLDVVRNEHADHAVAAVEALSVYGHDPQRLERIQKVALQRSETAIREAYQRIY
jgi:HEAT repeat protein